MESLAQDLETLVRTPLSERHVQAMHEIGEVRAFAADEMLVRLGDPSNTFFYILEGEIEALDPRSGMRYGMATAGPTQFVGEISFLNGGNAMLAGRATRPSRLLCVERTAMLSLMSRIPFRSLTLGERDAEAVAAQCRIGAAEPAVIYGKHQVVQPQTPAAIAKLFGMDLAIGDQHVFDLLVVGGGPAGIAAGVYAGAEGLSALVIEDLTIGGQAGMSSRIENYMGFPTGISGADLCWRGEVQAMKFGTRFAVPRRAQSLTRDEAGVFHVRLEDGDEVCARAVLVATGVQYRRLPIDRLEQFESAGIYYAATEIEARYCHDTDVIVIGGGNSAGQAAMFLCRTARHVHLLVRGASLADSMSDYLLSRLEADPTITIHFNAEMTQLHGTTELSAITIRDRKTSETREQSTRAVFVMVGAAPNTQWLSGHVALDDKGFVKTGDAVGQASAYSTSSDGIFAVGDVRAGSVKRVASAVGEGSVVVSRVWEFLSAARAVQP
ncbi:MAG: FAD-dependent oxidoreductase [Burkholderiales bacterium]